MECFSEAREVFVFRDIAIEGLFGAQFGGELLDRFLEALALVGQDELRAFAAKRLRDGVGEAPLIGDAQDERSFSGEEL